MTNKLFFLFLMLCTLLIISCNQSNSNINKTSVPKITELNANSDSLNFVVLPYDSAENWIKFNNVVQDSINKIDLKTIDTLLKDCIDNYNQNIAMPEFYNYKKLYPNSGYYKPDLFKIELNLYLRQYISIKTKQNKRIVLVNCFNKKEDEIFISKWKTKLIKVYDGGKNFFNLKIDLTNRKYYEMEVNGKG